MAVRLVQKELSEGKHSPRSSSLEPRCRALEAQSVHTEELRAACHPDIAVKVKTGWAICGTQSNMKMQRPWFKSDQFPDDHRRALNQGQGPSESKALGVPIGHKLMKLTLMTMLPCNNGPRVISSLKARISGQRSPNVSSDRR